MSIFNGKRLTNETFKLDVERMRTGWYSDKYFENVGRLLSELSARGYTYQGERARLDPKQARTVAVGDAEVEVQWFTRRKPYALVAGVDKALAMLRHCTGYFDADGNFIETWDRLMVEAIHDGALVSFGGDPSKVQPVMRVRGRYRHFAMLETPTLGILSRASRIATNVYDTLIATGGKAVLFFPARFDVHEVQAADGYAYDIAVRRYNMDYGQHLSSFVSTDAQGDWWGGLGSGTVPHAVIACFMGDTAEALLAFAATQPPDIPRIALVDFNNDSIGDALATMKVMFERYLGLMQDGQEQKAARYRLFGVRLDTSTGQRDVSIEPMGDPDLDLGVNPRLVVAVRKALDRAWESWGVSDRQRKEAEAFCQGVKIVVSGGFTVEKINRFERLGTPVDIYGVGSSLVRNDRETNTDFTADVVRLKVSGAWVTMAKVGRAPGKNSDLLPVS
ncbi:MAG TPA: nicotinate phosphoribosyltransferase [Anaerolineae bacterium]|jgi:nicotinate phosphoribosyltransferase|nr:nicotinate phosphoribosyltransferase [Anaerolineae bacterium]